MRTGYENAQDLCPKCRVFPEKQVTLPTLHVRRYAAGRPNLVVHVQPIYDGGGLRCISHTCMACAAWTNVRRVCLYRVDVRVAIGARFVVSIRSCLSRVTDRMLKGEHYRCDPVAVRRLGQGWARNAPAYTHDSVQL